MVDIASKRWVCDDFSSTCISPSYRKITRFIIAKKEYDDHKDGRNVQNTWPDMLFQDLQIFLSLDEVGGTKNTWRIQRALYKNVKNNVNNKRNPHLCKVRDKKEIENFCVYDIDVSNGFCYPK